MDVGEMFVTGNHSEAPARLPLARRSIAGPVPVQ